MVNILDLLYTVLYYALQLYTFAIIAYIFMSWFPGARESAFGEFLSNICEPYLAPFRRIIPPIGMFDFSPIVAIFLLQFAVYGLNFIFSSIS